MSILGIERQEYCESKLSREFSVEGGSEEWWIRTAKRKESNFWSRVDVSSDPDACWPWKGAKSHYGHGVYKYPGVFGVLKATAAHRVAFQLHHDLILHDNSHHCFILHSCDNPPCCNPRHLRIGSQKENVEDVFKRNRGKVGEAHWNHVVTEAVAAEILLLHRSGVKTRPLMDMFSLGRSAVEHIIYRRCWKYLP